LLLALILVALSAVGCKSLPFKDGNHQCEPGEPGTCPDDMTCVWSAEVEEYRCVDGATVCGNGQVESGEACDGEALGGQTCLSLGYLGGTLACATNCMLNTSACEAAADCNNGVLDPGEDCDGVNLGGQTCEGLGMGGGTLGCSPACRYDPSGCDSAPVCGNGQQEYGEACDDGNTVSCDGCSADCQVDGCGNGIVDCGEACDDGNTTGGDGCSANCLSDETCGNGVTDGVMGEVCDDGNTIGGDGCSADCLSDETCGNSIVDTAAGEACDDGNVAAGDGCSANCASDETCGNGIVDSVIGEACDDGNTADGDGCSASCASDETCGNGIVDTSVGEACDDGNTTGGDGCSSACTVEDYFACSGVPNVCTCVVYVDLDGSITQRDGTQWSTAYATVPEGIDQGVALGGCEVWVAQGTYYVHAGSATDTVTLRSGVDVYGGFAGGETALGQRNWSQNITTLDGRPSAGSSSRVYHVVTGADGATLDGFTITQGEADGAAPHNDGGGIYVDGTSPTFANCRIEGNTASHHGGGAHVEGGAPIFVNCIFSGNWSYSNGGLSSATSSVLLERCIIHNNSTTDDCAGIGLNNGYPVVQNSVFYENQGGDYGGGMCVTPNSVAGTMATVVNNTFYDNHGPHGGGGISVNTDYATVANNLFSGNTGTWGPNLLVFSGRSPITVANCITSSPGFVNAATHDFHLLSSSPCVDFAAGDYAPATDFDGAARYDVPGVDNGGIGTPPYCDAGAFEYNP
jgi:cysteine-rich repeat protein